MGSDSAGPSAKSASLWAMAGSLGTRGLSFVFFMLIARAMSPAELGVMAMALAVSVFADALIDFGLSTQVMRHQTADDPHFFSGVLWLQIALATGSGLIIVALSGLAASWYHEPRLQWALWGVCAASWLNAAGLVPHALLSRRLQHKSIALRNTLATFVGGCIGVAMAHAGQGVLALVVMHVANALTGVLTVWWAARWRPLWAGRWRTYLDAIRPVVGQARHQLGTQLLEAIMVRLDQVLIGAVFGAATLGVYALAVRIFDVLFQVTCGPIASVLLPYLARVAGDVKQFRERFLSVLGNVALLAPPIYVCAALYAGVGVKLVFGGQWEPAIPYLEWALGMGAVQAVGFVHPPAFMAIGKPNMNWWIAVVSSALWALGLLFLPKLAPIFAMLLWVGRSAIGLVLQVVFTRRLIGVRGRDYWQAVRWPLAGAAVVSALAWVTRHGDGLGAGPWLGPVVMLMTSMLLFAAMAWTLSADVRHFASGVFGRWRQAH
ncbi:MAG: lipopolysaccharide biosynthesis protein [Aquabacterium sp.]|uniref:lipopolysaccharide biosynthesis protein n=1 Tax=Aquabacterium sp. TaxID=1872578 RepID=UPI0025C60508|nr:lipopolysaccharide biosynthesis protein [Aquabacterium sp.]MBI3382934.1 lipopolysaccharide biosynthesis protein [Aquabacterium sp.]